MAGTIRKVRGWQDMVLLAVLVWLFISPVVLGYFGGNSATLTAMIVAAVASLTSQLGLSQQRPWEDWFNLFLAVLLVASPWLFGYVDMTAAVWNSVVVGIVMAVLGVMAIIDDYARLRRDRETPMHRPNY